MLVSDACLVWGEGSVVTACLGAATPRPPIPLSSNPRRRAATRLAAAALAVLLLPLPWAGAARAADAADGWATGPGLPQGGPVLDSALGLPAIVYPIEMPPGRNGMTPVVALHYSSALTNGAAGYGFGLAVGSIERSTRLGPPRFDNTDTLVLTLEGRSLDLLPIDGASTRFRTVLESGFLVERVAPGPFGSGSTFFVARGPDGRRYRFGAVAGPEGASQVPDFKWGLDRVEDTSGNVMTIDWRVSGKYLFPARIDYASHPATGLAATNRVEFCWEARGDRVRTAAGEVLTHRLHEIRTFSAGEAARSTTLVYDTEGDLSTALGLCRSGWESGGGTSPGGAPPRSPVPGTGGGRPQIAPEASATVADDRPGDGSGPGRRDRGPADPAASLNSAIAVLAPTAGEAAIPAGSPALPPEPSILVQIRRGDGRGAFLPPIEYEFRADRAASWPTAGAPGMAPPAPFVYSQSDADEDAGTRLVDLDRDGLLDVVQLEGRQQAFTWTTTATVWLNTGGAYVPSPSWSAALQNLVEPGDAGGSAWFVIKRGTRDRVENGVRFADVNDDGYVDVVRSALWFGTGLRKGVFLNTGAGFTRNVSGSWAIPDEPFTDVHDESTRDVADDRGVRLADVDGDGRVDLLVARAEWGGAVEKKVYRHDGGGWRLDTRWVLPDEPFVRHIPHGHVLDMGVRVVELNGDLFPDLLRAAAIDGVVRTTTWINSGTPGGAGPTWTSSGLYGTVGTNADHFVQVSSAGDGSVVDHGLRVADVDGDGRTELVAARRWSDGTTTRMLYTPLLTGGWAQRVWSEMPWLFVVRSPGGIPRDQGVRIADVDGDGGLDLLLGPPAGTREWRPNRAWQGRALLTSYSNGLGGRTTLAWSPAPHGGLVEGDGPAALPFALPVVSEVSVSDGLGGVSTTRYAYDGGFFHHRSREFRGFHRVIETTADGAATIETRHAQQPTLASAPLRGAPLERLVRRAGDGRVFTRTVWTYDAADGLPPLGHPLRREETALYDWSTTDPEGAVPVRRTATTWTPAWNDPLAADRRLLRREIRREGDLDDPADDRISVEEYAHATTALATGAAGAGTWILDQPWHASLSDASGVVVSESWTAWDGQAIGAAPLRGLPTRVERRGGSPGAAGAHGPGDPANPVVIRTYDPQGGLATEVDPLGRTRRTERGVYDPARTFPEREVDPLGRVTERRFDPGTGLLLRVVDANGRALEFEYDGFGRRIAEWGPGDSRERPTVSYRHDLGRAPGRVFRWVRETSGTGERAGTAGMVESIAWFDGLGRLAGMTVESPAGRTATRAVAFDAMGRVTREAEPFDAPAGDGFVPVAVAPFARTYSYDAAGRLIGAIGPDGATVAQEHAGWTIRRFDPMGHRRDLERNAFGDVVRVRDYEGAGAAAAARPPATYAHDAAGRVVTVTDPEGGVTRVSWDALGRRVALDDVHIGAWAYRYDLAGNLVEETDPLGRITRMTHDALDRPVDRLLADGRRVTWTYDEGGAAADAIGRVTTITDPTGTQNFSYDPLGRVTLWSRRLGGALYALGTSWDAMGRITRRDYPGGRRVDFSYDAGGQLSAALPWIAGIGHNPRGQVTSLGYASGARAERIWDEGTGTPESLVVRDPTGAALLALGYENDADGLVTAIEDHTASGTPVRDSFAYDGRHRLIQSGGSSGAHTYSYDDAGTPTARDGVAFERDDAFRRQRLTRSAGGGWFAYDPLGATTEHHAGTVSRSMTYDATGRMTRLVSGNGSLVVTSAYDAAGTLVSETTDRPGSRSVLLMPFPGVEVRDGRITVHVQAGDLRLATVDPDGEAFLPISDHVGTTRLVLDRTGRSAERAAFGPYGEAAGGVATQDSLLRYGGARLQDGTGLVVMGWRHYDPALGRFLEPDPVLASPLDTQALNRYAYARNNPVNLADPDGRNPLVAILFWGAIALLDRDTRADVAQSVGLTAASIVLTGLLGPGAGGGLLALKASIPALYAAAATTVLLDSRLGEGIVAGYAALYQDLGLSPRGAGIAGRLTATWLLNSHFQRSAASLIARSGPVRAGDAIGGRGDLDAALGRQGIDPASLSTPSGDAYGTSVLDSVANGDGLELDRFQELRDVSGDVVGVYGVRDIGAAFDHGAAAFVASGGAGAMAPSGAHFAYGLGGISTQQFARDLFAAGYSGSLFTLTGRASDFLIELVYGPYGGGLAFGVGMAASADRSSGAGP